MRGVAGVRLEGAGAGPAAIPEMPCRALVSGANRIVRGSQTRPMWFAPPTLREGAFSLPLRKADKPANLMED